MFIVEKNFLLYVKIVRLYNQDAAICKSACIKNMF